MAKLYFYYGAMGSSKTANALMKHYNFQEKGRNPILLKSEIDTRDGKSVIHSRVGLEMNCVLLKDFLNYDIEKIKLYDAIILDEAQFATTKQIEFLSDIVDFYDISVYCYGLRCDFKNELFEGSKKLLALADIIQEIETVCWCGEKAICNARYNEFGMVYTGEQVVLGANDKYVAVCRKHFKSSKLSSN